MVYYTRSCSTVVYSAESSRGAFAGISGVVVKLQSSSDLRYMQHKVENARKWGAEMVATRKGKLGGNGQCVFPGRQRLVRGGYRGIGEKMVSPEVGVPEVRDRAGEAKSLWCWWLVVELGRKEESREWWKRLSPARVAKLLRFRSFGQYGSSGHSSLLTPRKACGGANLLQRHPTKACSTRHGLLMFVRRSVGEDY